MVTGDAEETAVAIAKEAGILADEKKDVVLTHEEMEKLSDIIVIFLIIISTFPVISLKVESDIASL